MTLDEPGRRNSGILISAITKSGSSSFHGTAYEFLRNDALQAYSFFNNLQGRPVSPIRFNQFGGNLSGWIWLPKVSTPTTATTTSRTWTN